MQGGDIESLNCRHGKSPQRVLVPRSLATLGAFPNLHVSRYKLCSMTSHPSVSLHLKLPRWTPRNILCPGLSLRSALTSLNLPASQFLAWLGDIAKPKTLARIRDLCGSSRSMTPRAGSAFALQKKNLIGSRIEAPRVFFSSGLRSRQNAPYKST